MFTLKTNFSLSLKICAKAHLEKQFLLKLIVALLTKTISLSDDVVDELIISNRDLCLICDDDCCKGAY